MALTYYNRNLTNIEKLADHTKIAALKWHDYLVKHDIDILIYETIRTEAQQRENVKNRKSQTMKSYHLVGQALDFVPVAEGGRTDWNGYMQPKIKQAVSEAKRLGFEWGGDWKNFIDRPHLQFNHKGYGTDTFGKIKVEVKKEVEPSDTNRYRLLTGTFGSADDVVKAMEQIKKEFGWTTYEKTETTDWSPEYRLITGTFIGKNAAEHAAKQLKEKFGWTSYVQPE